MRLERRAKHICLSFTAPVLTLFFLALPAAQAQTPGPPPEGASTAADPRHSWDFEINFGTIVPSRDGLVNMVPGWGLRTSIPSEKGIFELSAFSARGNSEVYRTAAVDYRMDIDIESVAAHFLFGLHADQYYQSDPTSVSKPFAGGWHFGGGITTQLVGPILFRADFRYRVGPGEVLDVTVGLVYRLALGESAR